MANEENNNTNLEKKGTKNKDILQGCGCLIFAAVVFVFLVGSCTTTKEMTPEEITKINNEKIAKIDNLQKQLIEATKDCDAAYLDAVDAYLTATNALKDNNNIGTYQNFESSKRICLDAASKIGQINIDIYDSNYTDKLKNAKESFKSAYKYKASVSDYFASLIDNGNPDISKAEQMSEAFLSELLKGTAAFEEVKMDLKSKNEKALQPKE